MFRSFITLAAVAGLVAGASAQQTAPVGKVTNPSFGSFDFQNGFTQTSGNNGRAGGPDVLFNTMACAAYYYGGIGTAFGQEWLDEAQFADRGVTGVEEVNEVQWGYCDLGTAGYFDAVIRVYNDTVAFIGPSIWANGSAAIPACNVLITGLPDNGCWYVTVDLSCGFECILPQKAGSGSAGTIGWAVVSRSSTTNAGPILATQACAGPGTSDLFEWRDNPGTYWGFGPYYHVGTFWFGGGAKARGDFLVGFAGSPEDTQGVYGSEVNDVLCLQALTNAEPGSSLSMTVDGADAAAKSYVLIIATGTPVGAVMTNGFGKWTRQFNVPAIKLASGFSATGPTFAKSQGIPSIAPSNAAAVVQIVRVAGPGGAAAVDQATNGLAVRL